MHRVFIWGRGQPGEWKTEGWDRDSGRHCPLIPEFDDFDQLPEVFVEVPDSV